MIYSTVRLVLFAAVAGFALSACQPANVPPKDYTAFNKAKLRSILVVPVVNKSAAVNAPDGLLVTLPVPIAERGFYVSPTHLVRRTMEDDGLGDADLVHRSDPTKLAKIFGADAVLYAVIEEWTSRYVVLSTSTTVMIAYTLKSGKTGETLWSSTQRRTYTVGPQGGGVGGLIADAISAAIERAAPNYMPLARSASNQAIMVDGQGMPLGPYYQVER